MAEEEGRGRRKPVFRKRNRAATNARSAGVFEYSDLPRFSEKVFRC